MIPVPAFEIVLLTITGVLPIMNPFSTAPLFLSLTTGMDDGERNRQALKACAYAFTILATFFMVGSYIIDFFGISLPGIRVAGGLIIGYIGFRMLFPEAEPETEVVDATKYQAVDVSFTPLALPMMAGPGTISVLLAGSAEAQAAAPDSFLWVALFVMLGLSVCVAVAYLTFRTAALVLAFIGQSGMDGVTRLFGFLLVCIAMQFVLVGVDDFYGITAS
ncbi:MAG: MarC family NAAT transporter [Pseudomonadota bacterium]